MGLEKLPPQQIRYTDANTFPFIEGYYMAGAPDKGDSLLMSYARNLMQYIDYYLDFQGIQGDMVTQTIIDKMQSLDRLYYLAAYMGRQDVLAQLNDYYRTLGIYEDELIHPDLPTRRTRCRFPNNPGKIRPADCEQSIQTKSEKTRASFRFYFNNALCVPATLKL